MDRRAVTVVGRRASLGCLLLASLARGVAAHPVGGSRFEAPLPLPLLLGGAAATVALTALLLAVADRRPPDSSAVRRIDLPPAAVAAGRWLARPLFLAAVVAAVGAGLLGRQVAAENAATLFVWPVWIRGLALVSVLVGSPWGLLSPWRAIYRGLVRLEGGAVSVFEEYPAALGDWPALVGFLTLVAVVENLTTIPESPRLTAVVVAGYGLVTLGGALLFGEAWLRRADPLSVLYRLFGRVAPVSVTRNGGSAVLAVTPPWRDCRRPVGTLALAAFAVATVYTVSFDGFTSTRAYVELLTGMRAALGVGWVVPFAIYGLGFGLFLVTFFGASTLCERLGAGRGSGQAAALRFAPTLLPIAAAYEVAHYYPFVLRNLGQLWAVAARPLVPSAEPLALVGWLSLPAFWWSQVVLVVVGHLVAVVAAHGVAVARYGSVEAGRRAHLPLVVVMVAYTGASLWIVSQPVVQ
ncbi:hypothetical protein [Natronomonas marina]|jgi:hypothetical protein|uniref:hypothetical protein n=1 Tax=Natronomonas marina TaxID=2961939 RepID=UPI0020C9BF9C|nr:hypothetical protein [Natronomonas marina]